MATEEIKALVNAEHLVFYRATKSIQDRCDDSDKATVAQMLADLEIVHSHLWKCLRAHLRCLPEDDVDGQRFKRLSVTISPTEIKPDFLEIGKDRESLGELINQQGTVQVLIHTL